MLFSGINLRLLTGALLLNFPKEQRSGKTLSTFNQAKFKKRGMQTQ